MPQTAGEEVETEVFVEIVVTGAVEEWRMALLAEVVLVAEVEVAEEVEG